MQPPLLTDEQTTINRPFLCPEIRLRLVTGSSPLWRATEADLARFGLSDPFWAFCWGGGQAVARHVLDHPTVVRDRRVLDFGAGGGVVGIAAAKAGARTVHATEIDSAACRAIETNAALNDVTLEIIQEDLIGDVSTRWDVILAGDMCYERQLTQRLLDWLKGRKRDGVDVLIGDPGRGLVEAPELQPVATYQVPEDIDADGTQLRDATVYAL